MKSLKYYICKEFRLSETIYLTEETTLEDLKEQSRYSCLNLFSSASGNFSIFELFLGTYSEFEDYLVYDRKEDLDLGNISIEKTELSIETLKQYINNEYTGERV